MAAGIFGYDNRQIMLPAKSMGETTTMSCKIDKSLTSSRCSATCTSRVATIQLTRGATVGEEVLYEEDWSFDDQPVAPVKVTINAGDTVWLRCTHDNPTDLPIA